MRESLANRTFRNIFKYTTIYNALARWFRRISKQLSITRNHRNTTAMDSWTAWLTYCQHKVLNVIRQQYFHFDFVAALPTWKYFNERLNLINTIIAVKEPNVTRERKTVQNRQSAVREVSSTDAKLLRSEKNFQDVGPNHWRQTSN